MPSTDLQLRKLARLVASHDKQLKGLGNTPQLPFSSIEDGSVEEYDRDGTLVSIIGKQWDNTHGAVTVGGPAPTAPSEPTVEGAWVRLKVKWDGVFRNANGLLDPTWPAPMDFARVEVHASTDSGYAADTAATIKATFETPRGGEVDFFVPAGTWYIRLVSRSLSGKSSTPSQPIFAEATGLVVDEEFQEAVISRMAIYLTNTDGSGYTSQITGEGIKVFYTDPETSEVQDRISLGTFNGNADYFGLTDDNNELSVSIDKDGGVSGRVVSAETSLLYRGTELTEILGLMPRGIVSWASRATSSSYWATSFQPYLHLRFAAEPGRSYIVQTTPIWIDGDTSNTEVRVHLHYETAGANASTSSQIIAEGMSVQASTFTRRSPITINRLITPPEGDVSLLISYSALSGRAKISANALHSVVLIVTDIGPAIPETGEDRNGTADGSTTDPTPPPTVKNYDKYYEYTGVRSYLGNGGQYNYQPGKGYQGLQPYTSNGNLKSIWTFPSLTAELSGATITDVYAYFYFEHWNYGSGGTARIRTHGYASAPATYGGIGNGIDKAGWPRANGQWVRLPSNLYAGFQSGSIKGLALDGDNTLQTYGIANRARLRIKFTK